MKLRKWVKILLTVICMACIIIMASECEDTFTFIVSHLLSAVVFSLNAHLLLEY